MNAKLIIFFADILMKVKHPNVLSYFGIYLHEGDAYIVTGLHQYTIIVTNIQLEFMPLGSVRGFIMQQQEALTYVDMLKM